MTFDPSAGLPGMVEAESMQCRFPSRLDWIEPTVEYLRQRALLCGACDEDRAGRIMIGLHEAISNAIIHGNLEISSELKEQGDEAFARELALRSSDERYGGRLVTIRVDYDGSECHWTITDEGNGFDVDRVMRQDPVLGEANVLASGRGILMMRAFFDSIRYELGGRRVVLTVCKSTRPIQRQAARLGTHQRVRIVPVLRDGTVDWQAAYDGLAHNLSSDGMAVLQAHLATAERVLIGIESNGQTLFLPANVRHCRQFGSDVVELGCQFSPQSPHDPLASPADRATAFRAIAEMVELLKGQRYPDDDRRAHPRVDYTNPIQIEGGAEGEPTIGFGRDLSTGGIAFVTTAPIPLKPILLVLPSISGPPVRIPARILRCDCIMDGFYDVGARFENG